MHNEPMRLFVALPVPDHIRQWLADSTSEPRTNRWFQKWVHPQDYHVTLKFLGETDPSWVDAVCAALDQAARIVQPFSLVLGQSGWFGPPALPSVWWSGVSGDLGKLRLLQREVNTRLHALGVEPDKRPYSPHITLARRANVSLTRDQLRSISPESNLPSSSWQVEEMVLFRTHMGRSPMYEAICRFPLQHPRQNISREI